MNATTWPLRGGVHPQERKTHSVRRPIAPAPLVEHYQLSLRQHQGAPAKPCVAAGDKVLKGDLLAKAAGPISANLHAPTSGTVVAIAPHPIAPPSGMSDTGIELAADGRDQWRARAPIEDPLAAAPEQLLNRIRDAGIVGLGGAGFPAAIKLSLPADETIRTLIINGTECEPYITADDALMRERAASILSGVAILMRLLNPQRVLIGVEDNKPRALQAIRQATDQVSDTQPISMEVVSFPTIYPSGGEKQLIEMLTGEEVPNGKLPAQLGILVQNVGTCEAIYRAVTEDRPLISRITTLTGEALSCPGNLEVRLGTPIGALLAAAELQPDALDRLIMGGPMMGFALTDLAIPVVKTTNCLIAATASELPSAPPPAPCIRCGKCAQVCPMRLLPQQLYWHARAKEYTKATALNLMDCIECGACAYVCPSHIPLVQHYRAAKGEIRDKERDRVQSERAKERFQHREARLAQQAADKAARRIARAATKAKQAPATEAPRPDAAQPVEDPRKAAIQAAVERRRGRRSADLGPADQGD